MERSDKRELKPTGSRKKPYSRPRLEVYGNLREITKAVSDSAAAKSDGGGVGNPHHVKTF
jgi:hypothetical protein